MSHITVIENKIKMDNEIHIVNALNMMKNQFAGLTYQKSADGKIIQVHYSKIDDPVKRWHPEGNLRFTKKNDGTWEMSGDGYNCRKDYNEVVDAAKVCYQKSGVKQWCQKNGYTSTEQKVDGKIVVRARKG